MASSRAPRKLRKQARVELFSPLMPIARLRKDEPLLSESLGAHSEELVVFARMVRLFEDHGWTISDYPGEESPGCYQATKPFDSPTQAVEALQAMGLPVGSAFDILPMAKARGFQLEN